MHSNIPIPQDAKFGLGLTPVPLMNIGLNIGVIVSTASAFRSPDKPQNVKVAQIIAHFDTGASITSIDIELARKLELIPIGQSQNRTAAGLREAANFVVDLSFPGSALSQFTNLQIGSCLLTDPNYPAPFQLLIGRDIMSKWNIVWNGPTSTVFIYD